MGIDVMIAGAAEEIASRPSDAMLDWLDRSFEDYEIRYGYIALTENHVTALAAEFSEDEVGRMILQKVDALRAANDQPPYVIELMISA